MMLFKTKQRGNTFLSVLCILTVITTFILTSLQGTFLYKKSFNQLLIKSTTLGSLEKLASKLAYLTQGTENFTCLTEENSPNQVVFQLKNKKGCLIRQDQQNYYYLIEKLGSFPCIQSEVNAKKYSTLHRRITIFSPDQHAFLQLRIAYLEPIKLCKNRSIINVIPGILSWRYF